MHTVTFSRVMYFNDVSADIWELQYIGCYIDGGADDRVMTSAYKHDRSMTVEMCHQHCQQSVNTYFGLEVTT